MSNRNHQMNSNDSILASSEGDPRECHPLQGVEKFLQLPPPEELENEARDIATESGILALIGDYRTRCLFSKNWMLRDAALQRVQLMLTQSEFLSKEEGIGEILNELLSIVQIGLEDDVDQVLISASILAEHVFTSMLSCSEFDESTAAYYLDAIAFSLIGRLPQVQHSVEIDIRRVVLLMAQLPSPLGVPLLAEHALDPITPEASWRTICCRLQVLSELVNGHGIGPETGLQVNELLNFIVQAGSFVHSDPKVRNDAKLLVMSLFKYVGEEPLMPTMREHLRPKQLRQYLNDFKSTTGEASFPGQSEAVLPSMDKDESFPWLRKVNSSKESLRTEACESDGLPQPDELRPEARTFAEKHHIISLFGDYYAQCLFSEKWILREGAVNKVHVMMINDEILSSSVKTSLVVAPTIQGVVVVIELGVSDEAVEVMIGALSLLSHVLHVTSKCEVSEEEAISLFGSIIRRLVLKLSHRKPAHRRYARFGLDAFVAMDSVLKLPKLLDQLQEELPEGHQKDKWTLISARLRYMRQVVVHKETAVEIAPIALFLHNTGALTHAVGQVREDAKQLVIALHRKHCTSNNDSDSMEAILQMLRPKQRKQFEFAFSELAGTGAALGSLTDVYDLHYADGKIPSDEVTEVETTQTSSAGNAQFYKERNDIDNELKIGSTTKNKIEMEEKEPRHGTECSRTAPDELILVGPSINILSADKLPEPEELTDEVLVMAENCGIMRLLGERFTSYLFSSKEYVLRKVAVQYAHELLIDRLTSAQSLTEDKTMQGMASIIRIGLEDEVQQVLVSAIAFMEDLIRAMRRTRVRRSAALPLFSDIVSALLLRLSDEYSAVQNDSRRGLDIIVNESKLLGLPAILPQLLKRPDNFKQRERWRRISSQLQYLTQLVNKFGVDTKSQQQVDLHHHHHHHLLAESVLDFPRRCEAFSHSVPAVRRDAKQLVLAVQRQIGNTASISAVLEFIRPKLRQAYQSAFDGSGDSDVDDHHIPESEVQAQEELKHPNPSMVDPTSLQEDRRNKISNAASVLLGDYYTRCLLSDKWVLREAAVNKVHVMMKNDQLRQPSVSTATDPILTVQRVKAVMEVIALGVVDEVDQVVQSTILLLTHLMIMMNRSKLDAKDVLETFQIVTRKLVERLVDDSTSIDAAHRGLVSISMQLQQYGIHTVLQQILEVQIEDETHRNAALYLSPRLRLLTSLVEDHSAMTMLDVTVDAVLQFPRSFRTFVHNSALVREHSKALVVALYRQVGEEPLQDILSELRPKQQIEYKAAFRKKQDDGKANENHEPSHTLSKDDGIKQCGTIEPAGAVPVMTANLLRRLRSKESTANDDGTFCIFCGIHRDDWNSTERDIHFWQQCAMLVSCPCCVQIVEVAGLSEHLLEECDAKTEYQECDVTGLAIRVEEMDAWRCNPLRVTAPLECVYCPLCCVAVQDTSEAWRSHLSLSCNGNQRIKHKTSSRNESHAV